MATEEILKVALLLCMCLMNGKTTGQSISELALENGPLTICQSNTASRLSCSRSPTSGNLAMCLFLQINRHRTTVDLLTYDCYGHRFSFGVNKMGVTWSVQRFNSKDADEFTFETALPPNLWRQICLKYELSTGQVSAFINGKEEILSLRKDYQTSRSAEPIRTGRNCVTLQKYSGKIAKLAFFPHSSRSTILNECDQQTPSTSSLFQLDENTDIQHKGNGAIVPTRISLESVCAANINAILIQPAAAFFQIRDICIGAGGTLLSPLDKDALGVSVGGDSSCLTTNNITSWTGMRKSGDLDSENECIAVDLMGKVHPLACVRRLPCSLCLIPPQRFTLYGHEGNFFDFVYFIVKNSKNEPSWQGISGSKIERNNNSWIISSDLHKTQWRLPESILPIGRQKWDVIVNEADTSSELMLTLTVCQTWQFACDSGACIDMIRRCDDIIDCKDRSDENSCDVMLRPAGYNPIFSPPPRLGEQVPMRLDYHVDVYNLEKMTTEEGVARMDLGITLTWYDPRIQLRNLKPLKKNYFACSRVWVPSIRATSGNGEGAVLNTNQYEKFCFAFAKNKTDNRQLSNYKMDHTAPGKTHPLVHYLGLLAEVPCEFDLYMYPFDVQYCNLSFMAMNNAPNDRIFFKDTPGDEVPYLNAKTVLLEYELVALTTKVGNFKQAGDNITYFVITFHLHRLYGYHITNSFFPSLLMIIISYTTYFFELDDFTNRIMISLTAQLVLASLFTSTTASSVKTPYLKLIDLWYAAVITFCFLIIVSQVYVNVLLNSEKVPTYLNKLLFNSDKVRDISGTKKEQDSNQRATARKLNAISAIFIMILVVGFIFFYVLLSMGVM